MLDRPAWLRPVCRRRFFFFIAFLAVYTFFCMFLATSYNENNNNIFSEPVTQGQGWKNKNIPKTQCQAVEVAVVAVGSVEARQLVSLLKTLLFYRTRPLRLHVVCDGRARLILTTLFYTWQLPLVEVELYNIPVAASKQSEVFFSFSSILPHSVHKVIVVDINMRFLDDVQLLWTQAETLTPQQPLSLVVTTRTVNGEQQQEPLYSLVLMDLITIRNYNVVLPQTWTLLQDKVRELDCGWNLQAHSSSSFYACQSQHQRGVFYQPGKGAGYLEPIKEKLSHIITTDGEVYRTSTLPCPHPSPYDAVPKTVLDNRCAEFYVSSHMRRRTHLYYVITPPGDALPNEVTVMTMFTLDRFEALRSMLASWEGPVEAVAYLLEHEVEELDNKLARHAVLKNRRRFNLHIVYKRHRINAINLLRNVALRQTHTEYAVFLDVDLTPTPGLYGLLRDFLQNHAENKTCYILPTFEAPNPLATFPKNKQEMLKFLSNRTVIPYGQNRWNKGHKATNYNRWKTASSPYEVRYEKLYEPYVVMRRRDMPLYSEYVLDRMQDKILYTQELHKRGFNFVVLAETYLIHLPHPSSDSNYLYHHETIYSRCKTQILKEYRRGYSPFLVSPTTIPLTEQSVVSINNEKLAQVPSTSKMVIKARRKRKKRSAGHR